MTARPSLRGDPALRALARLAVCVFLTFMTIGMPLPVLPLYVHDALGFGNLVVGSVIGISFLATVLTRGLAGREADQTGARRVMLRGMVLCAVSGATMLAAGLLPLGGHGRLAVLLVGRLILGLGESQLIVAMLGWGIALVGSARSSIVLAWCGMAMYGSVAASAPVGFWLYHHGGLALVGAVAALLPLMSIALAWPVRGVPPVRGERQSFFSVVLRIWQPGAVVMLQGVGYAAIGAFIALDFSDHHWPGTGIALSFFGIGFVIVRLFAGHTPTLYGGFRVAIVSLTVETLGQATLFLAPDAIVALVGTALTGAGCSMVFPSMGVVVVQHTPAHIRSTALGAVAAFQDIAYGLTGPVTGLVATSFGYPAVFAAGCVCAATGLVIVLAISAGGLGWGRPGEAA
ncbi:major facilitator superfamily transporter [Ameyamaea chiangmaiensis NBRC 103196]|uniref:Arabinose transporter n=1 Tax=Ameyamaea chiangmaiensis TaxID=442969 RepID=A0A850PBP0_9PROT|nr:arabinose transporter [Ameyamaea chiangmaiensis]MBS4073841.1 arabinose transporter [Ameyamaea chiangmaiensis]NVN41504.1 arabinose transporter [Ameyamaea chiangmaiensis]GBQ68227.1 major facilitator superfamily transporter [Ameyamaea chiangmaiensis NBRC 103196]